MLWLKLSDLEMRKKYPLLITMKYYFKVRQVQKQVDICKKYMNIKVVCVCVCVYVCMRMWVYTNFIYIYMLYVYTSKPQ